MSRTHLGIYRINISKLTVFYHFKAFSYSGIISVHISELNYEIISLCGIEHRLVFFKRTARGLVYVYVLSCIYARFRIFG